MVEKSGIVIADLLQEGDVFGVVMKAAHELERHLQAGHEQIGAAEGRSPRIEIERGQRGASGAPGDVGRIGVIQVGQQARVVWRIRTGQSHRRIVPLAKRPTWY